MFFDFREPERLWFLLPIPNTEIAQVISINKVYFIVASKTGSLEKTPNEIVIAIQEYKSYM